MARAQLRRKTARKLALPMAARTIGKSIHGIGRMAATSAAAADSSAARAAPRSIAAAPRGTWLLPLAAIVLPALMLCLGGWLAWRSTWSQARSEVIRTADAAAEYGTRVLDGYVVTAGRINDRLFGLSDSAIHARERELYEALAAMIPQLPQAAAAYVVDREGYPVLAGNIFPVPRAVATARDRDSFIDLSGPNPPPVQISQVYVSRFDGKLFFAVSTRRSGTGNGRQPAEFDGMVSISVDPDSLARALRRLIDVPGDAVGFIRADGHVLTRTDGFDRPLPPLGPGSAFRSFADRGVYSADYVAPSVVDGALRLVAIRRLEGFPIYASVSRPRATVVAAWRATMVSHMLFGVPATIALVLLSLRVRQAQLRLIGANAGLRSDLSATAERLVQAQEAGGVHPFEVTADGGVICDDGLLALYGLPPGTRLDLATVFERVHPEDQPALAADRARRTKVGGRFAVEYRVPLPDGRMRWLLSRGVVLPNDGRPGARPRVVGVTLDISERKAIEVALAESEARLRIAQDAGGIGTWEWHLDTGRLRWSRKTFELFGFDPELPEPHHDLIEARRHPDDRERIARELAEAYETGTLDSEYRIIRPRPDGGSDIVWLATKGGRDLAPGRPRVMFGVHRDITARKRSEEYIALLAREVEHRSKNALAVVLATLRLTKASDHAEYVKRVEGRVASLARAHSLFAERGTAGADLRALLEGELAPFISRGSEVGPHVELTGIATNLPMWATQPMSMAVHELATNAAKYGALSVPGGRVAIDWHERDDRLHLVWRETGGPQLAAPPGRRGFGTQVIDQTIQRQLGGTVTRRWETGGIVCEIDFLLRRPLGEDDGPAAEPEGG